MRTLIIALLTTVTFASCCPDQKNCIVQAITMRLDGFTDGELDTVIIKEYLKADFLIDGMTDSFSTKGVRLETGGHKLEYTGFTESRAYVILIPQAKREYTLTNISTEKISCGKCNDLKSYEKLKYYHLNDDIVRREEIYIVK